jgi:hypothetical protein
MDADHSLFRTCLSRGLSSLPTSIADHADVTAPCRLQRSLQLEVSARSSGPVKPPAAPHGTTESAPQRRYNPAPGAPMPAPGRTPAPEAGPPSPPGLGRASETLLAATAKITPARAKRAPWRGRFMALAGRDTSCIGEVMGGQSQSGAHLRAKA